MNSGQHGYRVGDVVMLDGQYKATVTELHFDEAVGLCEVSVRRYFPGMDSPLLADAGPVETVALHRVRHVRGTV